MTRIYVDFSINIQLYTNMFLGDHEIENFNNTKTTFPYSLIDLPFEILSNIVQNLPVKDQVKLMLFRRLFAFALLNLLIFI